MINLKLENNFKERFHLIFLLVESILNKANRGSKYSCKWLYEGIITRLPWWI